MGASRLTWPRMTGMLSSQGEAVTWAATCVGMTGRQSMEKQVLPCLLVAGSHPGRGFLFQATFVPSAHGQRRTAPLNRFLELEGEGGPGQLTVTKVV